MTETQAEEAGREEPACWHTYGSLSYCNCRDDGHAREAWLNVTKLNALEARIRDLVGQIDGPHGLKAERLELGKIIAAKDGQLADLDARNAALEAALRAGLAGSKDFENMADDALLTPDTDAMYKTINDALNPDAGKEASDA